MVAEVVMEQAKDRVFLFTSESVTEGHPDKLCDCISDAILDACIRADPQAKVAVETAAKTGHIFLLGEISTTAQINFEEVARSCIKEIGYTHEDVGLDYKSCVIHNHIEAQSPEIANCVHVNKTDEEIGAGDQGIMFGYATDECEETYMPMTHAMATNLSKKLTEVRKNGTLPFLRPDGKTQVTCEYGYNPDGHLVVNRVHTVLISTQHEPNVSLADLKTALMKEVVEKTLPMQLCDEKTIYHFNPSGSFIVGGPHADAGLTGRKIIVDTYGGWGAHGGGAFSGKDPTKVDRSAAYAARWVAKSIVASGLAKRCLVQISYAIGVASPLSFHVDCYGSATIGESELLKIIADEFDLRPGMIEKNLKLKQPIYRVTASNGHFGRQGFPWEDSIDLKKYKR